LCRPVCIKWAAHGFYAARTLVTKSTWLCTYEHEHTCKLAITQLFQFKAVKAQKKNASLKAEAKLKPKPSFYL
jgi:hypothetical protein